MLSTTDLPRHLGRRIRLPIFSTCLVLVFSSTGFLSAQDDAAGEGNPDAEVKPVAEPSPEEQRAADLEAKLRQTLETSDQGARVLLELIDLYYEQGQVFGLVRAGRTFVNVQPGHPRHEEVMGKLMEGLMVASRNREIKSTGLQFLERYPESKRAGDVHEALARVFAREGQRREAADHWRGAWEKRGAAGARDAARAFNIYRDLRSEVTAKIMAEMAIKLMDQLPANVSASQFGVLAMYQTRVYGNQYTLSNQVGTKLLEKKLPLDDRQRWEIPFWMGDNYRAEKQYANAIKAYRLSIANGSESSDTHRNLIRSLYDAQSPFNELEKAVKDYLAAFPGESVERRMEMKGLLASAKQRDGDIPGALAQLQGVLREHGGMANSLFSWTGEEANWSRAGQIYQDAARQKPVDAYRLHYYAAFNHFRDRLKDENQAKALLRNHILYVSPVPKAGSEFRSALSYLLSTAASDQEFQAEVKRHLEHARKNAQEQNYTRAIEGWLNEAKKSKDEAVRNRYRFAAGEYDRFRKESVVKLWESGLQNRMRGHGAREQLLKTSLTPEQKRTVLSLHAYDIRNYGDSRRRGESIPFYQQLAGLPGSGYTEARQWLEAAANYGNGDQCRAALDYMLKLTQLKADYSAWTYASSAARKAEDPDLQKRVLQWVRQNESRVGPSNEAAGTIISNLLAMELEAEAIAYMKECVGRQPNQYGTASAVEGLLQRMDEEGDTRIAFLKPFLAQPSDNQSIYASRLADEYFKRGDFAQFEVVLRESKERSDARLLRDARGFAVTPSHWVNAALQNEEMAAQDKARVYRAVADLDYGRDSAVGMLALLAAEGHGMPPMQRLLGYRNTTVTAPADNTTYQYLFPWAQKAIGREDFAEGAALGTGLLNNITNVGVDTKQRTRSLIREAYGKMGALGMEVGADNPMAPLLEIGMHLRLGDQERALESYTENLPLFDEYLLELPTELVAFAAEAHIAAGGDKSHERAEALLRKWMIAHSESEKFLESEKARMQLLLAKNYDRAKRWEVARGEYTTVVNRYPDTLEAVEARFGIGETLMAQKIFDQAEETFTELADSAVAKVRVRGQFLLGVLESRKGNRDSARDIFREVLASMPDVSLANETLFNLAEVYGGEQRYLEQLELLRTVGRLGQESKRWHEPGRALSIVVQDTDLGISRGHTRIPVEVVTEPGGDREMAYLSSGGAGKGLFVGEIDTVLGKVEAGNGLLEVGGADLVRVDYPAEFKQEFQFKPLATGDIGLASDARFRMASSRIVDEHEETEAERLAREAEENTDLRRSIVRPGNEIKPGNPVYLRVDDLDRDLTPESDELMVKLAASSGDEVQAILRETGSHSGMFEGSIQTSDLPAGALASDTAIEHNPLMAIDTDESSTWISQPDGLTPKWLSVDLKELRIVDKGGFSTPNALDQAPVRVRLQGSHDGRFWYPLAEHPSREAVERPAGEFSRMTRRVWKTRFGNPPNWGEVLKLAGRDADETSVAEELQYASELPLDPEARRNRKADPSAVIWQGPFIQPRDGAVRFTLRGQYVAAMVDGLLVQPVVPVQREIEVDVFLEAGIHDLVFFSVTPDSGTKPVEILRGRENPNVTQVRTTRFVTEDFDLDQAFVSELKSAGDYVLGTMSVDEEGNWEFGIEPKELRHVKFVIDEYLGQAAAISTVTVQGPEGKIIPTEVDLLQLAHNDVLEITPGDVIDAIYIDELPKGGQPKNRALNQQLSATYYNAAIEPISYDFLRNANGQVTEVTKDLLRIDPGERITIEVTDFDLDATGQEDHLTLMVQVGDGEVLELEAQETQPTSGVFKTEIETYDPDAPVEPTPTAEGEAVADDGGDPTEVEAGESEETSEGDTGEIEKEGEPTEPSPEIPRIAVKPGHQVYLSYRDQENTFPGHAIDREAVVFVREPTDATMRIVATRSAPAGEDGRPGQATYLSSSTAVPITEGAAEGVEEPDKGVSYEVPLTVEVIDPDAARDSLSSVTVALALEGSDQPPVEVECRVSSAFSELEDTRVGVNNPALFEGRFVGQVMMKLGGKDSPRLVPRMPGTPNLVGRVRPPAEVDALTGEVRELPNSAMEGMVPVFNVTGADTIVASYLDAENLSGAERALGDRGRLRGNASIVVTDSAYEEPIESLQVGERLYLRLSDPDRDTSEARDRVSVQVTTSHGEKEAVELEETLSHSGVFAGSFKLKAQTQPAEGNLQLADPEIEAFFGETLVASYEDPRPSSGDEAVGHEAEVPVSDGTDGALAAFTKIFGDEDLAIQTQFHIAESYFELFKSHLDLERKEEAEVDLENGRRILRELQEDYPDPKYAPRISYLLGQFAQELKAWDEAIDAYESIVRYYGDHSLAADAQYKLGQCYEEAERFDEALEAYVTLAATYPENPLISKVMIRINEHFYRNEDFEVAAQVGSKFLERFENHEFAPRMAFRVGQCFYKSEDHGTAGEAFDDFVKRFPEDDLTPQALFWAGESYRQGNNVSLAFRRYNRCRWDFPESDAAKYARGRLALPEMLQQFEREAQGVEMENENDANN